MKFHDEIIEKSNSLWNTSKNGRNLEAGIRWSCPVMVGSNWKRENLTMGSEHRIPASKFQPYSEVSRSYIIHLVPLRKLGSLAKFVKMYQMDDFFENFDCVSASKDWKISVTEFHKLWFFHREPSTFSYLQLQWDFWCKCIYNHPRILKKIN